MNRLRVLVTNDDGFDAPGLRALACAVAAAGFDVVVAAPFGEASGSSAAITAVATSGHVAIQRRTRPDSPDCQWFAVGASPALIALIASRDAFGPPPDLVLSGVNRGANTGRAVIHSGTVGAAMTAAAAGIRAMAISLDVRPPADVNAVRSADGVAEGRHRTDARDYHWSSASEVAIDLLPDLLARPPGVLINLNVPDAPLERLRGVRPARLGGFGQVQVTETEPGAGLVRITLDDPSEVQPGSDVALLAAGYATTTALHPIAEADGFDGFGSAWVNRQAEPSDHRPVR